MAVTDADGADWPPETGWITGHGEAGGVAAEVHGSPSQRGSMLDQFCYPADRDPALLVMRVDGGDGPTFGRSEYAGDCGLDLATIRDLHLRQGEMVNASCGVAVALPPGTFGWIIGRSSTWSRWGLQVMPGIIDEGWRGELRAMIYRPHISESLADRRDVTICVPRGTRLAQLIILPNRLSGLVIREVDKLPPGSRGTRGFGSSGSLQSGRSDLDTGRGNRGHQ